MDRWLFDMWDDMAPADLEDALLSETDVKQRAGTVDLDRVWQRMEQSLPAETAPDGVDTAGCETGGCEGAAAHETARRGKGQKRRRLLLVLAAALLLGLFGTVFAAQMGYLDRFFHYKGMEQMIQQVQESVTDDGIVMTLEEVLPSATGGVLVVSFGRENGEPLPEAVRPYHLTMDILKQEIPEEQGYGSVTLRSYHYDEDSGKLFVYLKQDDLGTIAGMEILISANELGIYRKADIELPLHDFLESNEVAVIEGREHYQPYDEKYFYLWDYGDGNGDVLVTEWVDMEMVAARLEEHAAEPVPGSLPVVASYPYFHIKSLAVDEEQAYIYVSRDGEGDRQDTVEIFSLTDLRTGAETRVSERGNHEDGRLYSLYGIGADDLPYLVLNLQYEEKQVVSSGHWVIHREIVDPGMRIELSPDLTVELPGDGWLELKQVVVTPVNIMVKVVLHNFDYLGFQEQVRYDPDIALLLSDGTVIPYSDPFGLSWEGEIVLEYNRELDFSSPDFDPARSRYLSMQEMREVEYLLINGEAFPVDMLE